MHRVKVYDKGYDDPGKLIKQTSFIVKTLGDQCQDEQSTIR